MLDKNHLKKMAQNPAFIPGIYNYCDLWCEHCRFTSRCMNFAMSKKHFDTPKSQDIQSEKFWHELSETLQTTTEMIKEMAEEEGIDLDALDVEAEIEENRRNRETVKKHECAHMARTYAKMVEGWFHSAQTLFKEKEEDLRLLEKIELPDSNPVTETNRINNAVEVIYWYQHQIYIKLMRALHSKLDEKGESTDDLPKDSDGSAKVALIGIDRSIASWGTLRNYFSGQKEEILNFLILLDQLRIKTEKIFPKARSFMRPGLDTE